MAKNSGKNMHFWFDGVEIPVTGGTGEAEFPEIDVTDSSVASPGTDFLVGRGKRTMKVDGLIADVDGTEVITGTLTLGTRYKVTLGTITETQGTFPVGSIFQSDGTGTASGSNKVKPLGAKLAGKGISCTIATISKAITSLKYNEQYGEFDATDSASSGDSTEFITGRVKRTTSIEMIQKTEDADVLTTNPAAVAVVLTLFSGITITGSGIFRKKSTPAIVAGDMVKVTYDVTWVGVVTVVIPNILAGGVSKAAKLIFAKGASTNKEYTGNAVVMSMSIETDMNSPVKVSYTLNWSGAVTEAVAN